MRQIHQTKDDLRFLRQSEIFNPEEIQETITVIGGGNIGSNTILGIAKLGLKSIVVYEFDGVEEHNLASQFYSISDIGKPKIDCLQKHIEDFTGTRIVKGGRFTSQNTYGILIIAVDSMKERKRICKVISKSPPRIIIDGRMGGNTIEVYTRNTPVEYQKTLVKDVESVPCSERYISYSSLLCAGLITNQVKRILKDEEINPNIIFDIDTLRFA